MQVEFFHDPLCAWCYAMSPRVRQLAAEFPQLEVIHRSFALAPTVDAIEKIFGDRASGKLEILDHWRAANEHDDERRMQPELMAQQDFDYPWSMPALLGCEAARQMAGEAGYWDYFDAVQRLHLTACRNIADAEVLGDCAEQAGLDRVQLLILSEQEATLRAVQQDIARAHSFGLRGVPALLLDGRVVAQGALDWPQLLENVSQVMAQL